MKGLYMFCFVIIAAASYGQGTSLAENNFHQGSNLFINNNPEQALAAVKEGLKTDPQNAKLQALKKILEEEKKKQDQQKKEQKEKEQKEKQQQQKDQQNKDQKDKEKKEQEQKDQKKDGKEDKEKDKKDAKDQENKDQKDKDKEKKDQKDQKEKQDQSKELPPDVMQKLKDMKISEEKARMILEAMKNQEVQYLQQNKRQATKPKDRGKPDW